MGWLVIGISGVTCGGKTTLAQQLRSRSQISRYLCQDDYYLPKSSMKSEFYFPEIHHYNLDCLESLDMARMLEDTRRIINDETDRDVLKILLLEGILIFNYPDIERLCDLKLYITLDIQTCLGRRRERCYDPPEPPQYFWKCVWPMHILYRKSVEEVQNIVYINGSDDLNNIFYRVNKDVEAHMLKSDGLII